jgi:excisionase family DNA binding protein
MQHLTPEQAADLLQVNVVTIRRRCARGEIPGATKSPGQWRIPEQAFLDWLAQGQVREPVGVAKPASRRTMSRHERRFKMLVGGAANGEC